MAGAKRGGGGGGGRENGKREGRVPSSSPQSPPLFPFLPIPYPLPLSTPTRQAKPSSNLSNETFRIPYKRRLLKISQGKWIQGNLTGFKESVICSVVYVLFINRFKLLGFKWSIKLPWQLCCPQTEQKSQQSLIFSSRACALISRGSRLNSLLACLGFACSNFAKKNKRLLAV